MTEKKSKAPLIIALSVAGVVLIAGIAVLLYLFLPSRRLENALGSGRDNAANGYYDRAERAYENALGIDPENLEAYKGLVDVYMGREDYDEIEDLYEDASDALSKSDFKEFDKYVIKKLESAIKKAIKHEDWDLGYELADVYTELCDDPDLVLLDDLDDLSPSANAAQAASGGTASGSETASMDTPAITDGHSGETIADTQVPIDNELERYRDQLGDIYGYGYDEGEMIFDFTFYDEAGNLHSITEFQGQAVYINFFTTWCTYCFYEIPDMQDVAGEFDGDAVVIMIDLDEGPELGMQYAEDYDVDLPIYYIDGWELEGGLTLEAVPLSIVIDRYGMVHGNHLGLAEYDWMYDTLDQAVNTKY